MHPSARTAAAKTPYLDEGRTQETAVAWASVRQCASTSGYRVSPLASVS
jgi:hypothetical protein